MAEEQNEILQRYLTKVAEQQEASATALEQAELEEIATDLGISQDALRAAAHTAEKCLERGRGFLRHGLADDSITQLRRAVALAPYRIDVLRTLAEAHASRYRRAGADQDRREGEALLARCLEQEPGDEEAFRILQVLRRGRARSRRWLWLPLTAVSFFGTGLLIGYLTFGGAPGQRTADRDELVSDPAPPRAVAAPLAEGAILITPEDGGVPLEYVPGRLSGTTLEVTKSEHKVYAENAFYELAALLVNDSDQEIGETKLQIEQLAADGTVISSHNVEAVPGYAPRLRPGDVDGFAWLKESTATLSRVRITVSRADVEPAALSYSLPQPLPFTWKITKPGHVELAIRQRRVERRPHFSDKVFHAVIVEVANTGEGTVRSLKLIKELRKDGVTIHTDDSYVLTGREPALRPGQRRQVSLSSISGDFDDFAVAVSDLR